MSNKLLMCLLAISVIFAVLFVNAEALLNPTRIGYLFKAWGDNPIPELFGGYNFGESFKDTSLSVLYLIGYPLRLAYWLCSQVYTFFKWTSSGFWVGSGAGPGGGINGGVIQG